tara:strand:- start:1703 stop:2140 length:438 start_codon:yes stop_codon:yes gene_type:complete
MVDMLVAETIYPQQTNGKISCIECGLSYNKNEYIVLWDAGKLKYFFLSSTNKSKSDDDTDIVVCHSCLFSILKDVREDSKVDVIKFNILTATQELELEYDEETDEALNQGTNMDDFLLELSALDEELPPDTDDTHNTGEDDPDWL